MLAYLSLFSFSFLAATILPFSSEVILATLLTTDDYKKILLLFFASFGNILGSSFNWVLGVYSLKFQDKKWFPFKKSQIEKASKWFNKYGKWSLLFAWAPVVGDPLTYIAGTMKIRFSVFILLVSIGKMLRYIFISLLI